MSARTVDTAKLREAAQEIETKNNAYDAEWPKIYTEISALNVEFEGETSNTFNAKINEYRDDLQNLGNVVRKYIEHLRAVADKNEQLEERLNQEASSLFTGN